MDKAEFTIQGTVTRYAPDRAGKVVRLSVRTKGVQRDNYHDIKYFGALAGMGKGDYVLVQGYPGSEKDGKETNPKSGIEFDRWRTLLVATHIEVIEEAQGSIEKAPAPKRPDDDIPF